jgi:hypothetical protein
MLKKYVAYEPVRALVYPLLTALVVYLVSKGVVTADASPYVVAALAALLGIPAVETARHQVTPVAKQ